MVDKAVEAGASEAEALAAVDSKEVASKVEVSKAVAALAVVSGETDRCSSYRT